MEFNFNSYFPQSGDLNKPSFFSNKNNRIIAIVVLAVLGLSIIIGACVGCYFAGKNDSYTKMLNEELTISNEIYDLIKRNYYKDITREEFDFYASLGLSNAMDQFSGLAYASSVPTARFGITQKSDSYNNHIITEVSVGSPAGNAIGSYVDGSSGVVKLERGDLIVEVDNQSVEGLTNDVLNGDEFLGKLFVNLKVKKSNGKIASFNIKKSYFESKEAFYSNLGNGIGYIKLHSFTGTAKEDFISCANQFKSNANNKLILDLRDNGGGSTDILSAIASYIIHDKNGESNGLEIIKLKSEKSQKVSTYTAEGDNWLGAGKSNYKLAVLVNENSASASEALLGAIKFYCPEATIIGSPTYGKGIAQQAFALKSTPNYYISMTVGYFYVPVNKNGKLEWISYHGTPMVVSTGYEIESIPTLNFYSNDLYKEYYNNDFKEENAVKKAIDLLKSA